MSWKGRLKKELVYVIDLVQLPDGQRFLKPRLQHEAQHEHAAFISQAYAGSDLMSWREFGKVTDNVRLSDGSEFKLESHGAWFTLEEFNSHFGGLGRHGETPWVNRLAPQVPPK